MGLVEIINMSSTDERCRELLVRLRWPKGVKCPRCKRAAVELATAKQLFYCKGCNYQFTVTSGTIFNDSHLPLQKWFLATLLLSETREGYSTNQMKRALGVSYKTAWYLCHRIRYAMTVMNQLDGIVEVDEAYAARKTKGKAERAGGDHKQAVIGIIGQSGALKFVHAKDASSRTMRDIMGQRVSRDVDVIVTEQAVLYANALNAGQRTNHMTVNHLAKKYFRSGIHASTVEFALSQLKRGRVGKHRVSRKHWASYLNERTFRFNRRNSHTLFLDTLRHMVTAPVLTFERLTA